MYFQVHGIKYLTILLPNGMTAAVFDASLITSDNGLLNLSGVSDYLIGILDVLPGGIFPSLCGDAIMQLTPVIQNYFRNPSEREDVWNRRMSSTHMSLELDYGLVFNIFEL